MDITARVLVAFIVAGGGMLLSSVIMKKMMLGNRVAEWQENETVQAPGRNAMMWAIIHIRDDLGSLCGVVSFTNGLLAAVLALLVMK